MITTNKVCPTNITFTHLKRDDFCKMQLQKSIEIKSTKRFLIHQWDYFKS